MIFCISLCRLGKANHSDVRHIKRTIQNEKKLNNQKLEKADF